MNREAAWSSDLAHRIVAAAEAKAADMGVSMNIAVCDEFGVLKAFSRMDGAALLSVQIAQDKAYTAVGFGMPTDGWHEFIKDDPPLAAGAVGGLDGSLSRRGLPTCPPGRRHGRRGVGVGGGHYSQDMEVAQAGLADPGWPGPCDMRVAVAGAAAPARPRRVAPPGGWRR